MFAYGGLSAKNIVPDCWESAQKLLEKRSIFKGKF
jgi:hypothetical protein